MPDEQDQTDAASRLLIVARAFLEFATTSPNDEPDRLLKLIRLLDALSAAVIEVSSRVSVGAIADDPHETEPTLTRWPELNASYPSVMQTNSDLAGKKHETTLAWAFDDLRDICAEIREACAVSAQYGEQSAAKHLGWTYHAHWIWHAMGLRSFLAVQFTDRRIS